MFGILAPMLISKDIVDKLNVAINVSLQSSEVKNQLLAQGIDVLGGSKEEFARYIQAEAEKWKKLIKLSGSKMD